MLRSKLFFLLTITQLFQACLFSHTSGGKFPEPLPKDSPKERLIFLIRGKACVQICGEKDKSEICQPGPETCKTWAPGWYPVEFARDEKYFDFSEFYPRKKKKAIMNFPTNLLRKYDVGSEEPFEYKPVESIPQLSQEYPKGVFKNVVMIRLLEFEKTSDWPSYLPYFSLLIVPGYVEETFKIEVSRYDSQGKETKMTDHSPPKLKHWFGWIFTLWGPMFSSNEKHLLYRTVDTLPGR
ncbi:hypothetical protein CH371_07705 [Leptospira wolffii]|uniref:Lipoprotein n=1 Tax=Leptospira wolffii TaxID=409998 RepID=A0A2M9ZCV9_9LEPT|nr:hypothetical protein [Leptospira wolffii]PJZ66167.1 hypothetical protein CH371_07705 [Leptospira wolffii]